MAFTKPLDRHAIEKVRADVGAFLNTHPNPAFAKGAVFIRESFEIFELPSHAIPAAATNNQGLTESLRRTGQWHHQIVQKGLAVGLARSGPADSFYGGWIINAVFASSLAQKIARAVEIVERDRPHDGVEVFYVTIPAFQIVVFCLRGYSSEEIFVVSSSSADLQEGKFYPTREFLESLRQCRAITGLILRPEQPNSGVQRRTEPK